MKDVSEENMMPIFWLHCLHAPSLVSKGQSKLKVLSGNCLERVTFTLITYFWVAIQSCALM